MVEQSQPTTTTAPANTLKAAQQRRGKAGVDAEKPRGVRKRDVTQISPEANSPEATTAAAWPENGELEGWQTESRSHAATVKKAWRPRRSSPLVSSQLRCSPPLGPPARSSRNVANGVRTAPAMNATTAISHSRKPRSRRTPRPSLEAAGGKVSKERCCAS